MVSTVFLSFLLTVVFTLTQAINSTPDGRHGLARVMQFEGDELEKRGERGTWYTGKDLLKAACFSRHGLPNIDAHVNDMVGAMAMYNFEQCNKCMKITNNGNGKSIVIQIIDKCAACKLNKHIDLTPGAFRRLSTKGDLNVGVLNIRFKEVGCPNYGLFAKLNSHL
ncbi:hypothetical protein A0J61_04487 [Choanephora cucurbitarum]|uniref:Barwin domain-containing protein n=1 Tax=Choanephora cucurbitarum TaxID=101091 RepID=A0A1C7NED0_9FUNG|nr:hypothetical protein A0J61_04487 [Choanephora cucurbitarum]